MDKYIGKDIIHYGCGLRIDPDPQSVLAELAHSARKNIRKAERAGFDVKKVEGTAEELSELQKIWYLPEDPNFPRGLNAEDLMYMAYLDGELCGGVILLKVGSHLFLNNLTATSAGKKHQLQAYLLWHVINDLKDSGIPYIDIGVSYRPNLYRFFRQWATMKYPIIFNPPALPPQIRFAVFRDFIGERPVEADESKVADYFYGRPFTILPTIAHARDIAKQEGLIYKEVGAPQDSAENQVIDLTQLMAVPHGAVIVGREIPKQEIWDKYACYDHFKTLDIMGHISAPKNSLKEIDSIRHEVWQLYHAHFVHEDVEILEPEGFVTKFSFHSKDAEKLYKRYKLFSVECCRDGDTLHFPCHQNLMGKDVEYIYAILRGHLNLCSEWASTHVKGQLKDVR